MAIPNNSVVDYSWNKLHEIVTLACRLEDAAVQLESELPVRIVADMKSAALALCTLREVLLITLGGSGLYQQKLEQTAKSADLADGANVNVDG